MCVLDRKDVLDLMHGRSRMTVDVDARGWRAKHVRHIQYIGNTIYRQFDAFDTYRNFLPPCGVNTSTVWSSCSFLNGVVRETQP